MDDRISASLLAAGLINRQPGKLFDSVDDYFKISVKNFFNQTTEEAVCSLHLLRSLLSSKLAVFSSPYESKILEIAVSSNSEEKLRLEILELLVLRLKPNEFTRLCEKTISSVETSSVKTSLERLVPLLEIYSRSIQKLKGNQIETIENLLRLLSTSKRNPEFDFQMKQFLSKLKKPDHEERILRISRAGAKFLLSEEGEFNIKLDVSQKKRRKLEINERNCRESLARILVLSNIRFFLKIYEVFWNIS